MSYVNTPVRVRSVSITSCEICCESDKVRWTGKNICELSGQQVCSRSRAEGERPVEQGPQVGRLSSLKEIVICDH